MVVVGDFISLCWIKIIIIEKAFSDLVTKSEKLKERIMKGRMVLFIMILISLNNSGLWAQSLRLDKYSGVTPTKTRIRVASASVITDKWEKDTNWMRVEKMVTRAAIEGGANVVITPEGALDGYVINEVNSKSEKDNNIIDRFFTLGEPIDGPYIQKATTLADELNIYFVFGFLEREEKYLYNSAILIDPDGDIIGRYRKTHFAQGYTINPEAYKAGDEFPIFQTSFGKVGILICYDRQLPEPARILALKGAGILFIPSYGSYTDENGWNTIMLRTRARENRVPLVFSHPYQSLLIDKHGDVKVFGTGGNISYYEINLGPDKNNVMRNRRPDIYGELSNIDNQIR